MGIFKGWFFYLIIAVAMVLIATFASNFHSFPGEEKSKGFDLFSSVPTVDVNLDLSKGLPSEKIAISSSTSQKLTESATEAVQKIVSEAPEKLQFTGGVKGTIFRYLSEKKLIFEKNGFYFSEGENQQWDFGFQGAKNKIKLFSLKP